MKNVGSIACSGFVLLGAASDNSPINGSIMAVGEAHLFAWSNATPVDKSFIAGVKPSHTSLYGICTFEINRRWYLQRVVNGNTLVREVWGQVANIGNMTCAPHILLA